MITLFGAILFTVSITSLCYHFGIRLYRKYRKGWLNPLFTSSLLLVSLLFTIHLDGETYQQGSSVFHLLLQVAVVSLAIPLYKQWGFLKKNLKKIILGVVCGTMMGVVAVSVMAGVIFHLQEEVVASLIPRSITLPIALTISQYLGGASSATVIFVIMSALISLMIGPILLKHLGINSKAAKGLAMGTSAQMIGANRSLDWGEEEGVMGNVAMTTSALFLSVSLPLLTLVMNI
ncbi:Putative effector of murein hydrolase [Salinibacillus kushneri]|uniref:Putative effector of murein hydrolase n=1 Tax=Salinibacillus kushneri TaxID=237682 RepID=A0A1I0DQX3_9BACI|nr:LrgB family protein [Salinibacillus kushneri]SET34573.1 Putative effector of murein hydrolase [Salinibacillus kushneri]